MLEADKKNLEQIISTNIEDSRLTYVGPAEGKDKVGRKLSEYRCLCGSTIYRAKSVVEGRNTMKSCGCIKKDRGMLLVLSLRAKAHAAGRIKNRTHGKSKTKFYGIWNTMKNRCSNPNVRSYSNYGGRGITVDARWHQFEAFYEDMYESYVDHCNQFGQTVAGTQLDRIDNYKGYSKDNCRWVTAKENSNNKRKK